MTVPPAGVVGPQPALCLLQDLVWAATQATAGPSLPACLCWPFMVVWRLALDQKNRVCVPDDHRSQLISCVDSPARTADAFPPTGTSPPRAESFCTSTRDEVRPTSRTGDRPRAEGRRPSSAHPTQSPWPGGSTRLAHQASGSSSGQANLTRTLPSVHTGRGHRWDPRGGLVGTGLPWAYLCHLRVPPGKWPDASVTTASGHQDAAGGHVAHSRALAERAGQGLL